MSNQGFWGSLKLICVLCFVVMRKVLDGRVAVSSHHFEDVPIDSPISRTRRILGTMRKNLFERRVGGRSPRRRERIP